MCCKAMRSLAWWFQVPVFMGQGVRKKGFTVAIKACIAQAINKSSFWAGPGGEEGGGSSPGLSRSSSSLSTRTHLRLRVTPGLGALLHVLRPRKRLIRADLPTLGKPTTAARTARGCRLRAVRRALIAVLSFSASRTTLKASPNC